MRLFFALSLDEPQRALLAMWRQQALPSLSKPVSQANLHLTLAFIGELDETNVPALISSAGRLSWSPFEVRCDAFGQWPRSGISYLYPPQPPPALAALASQLQQLSRQYGGFDEKRPYQPHITLARGQHQLQNPKIKPPDVSLAVARFALYQSAKGRYQPLADFAPKP